MNTYDISRMILDCFANVGECVSAYDNCEICEHYNICNTITTAFIMVLEGKYYG